MNLLKQCKLKWKSRAFLLLLILGPALNTVVFSENPDNNKQPRLLVDLLDEFSEKYHVLFTYNTELLSKVTVEFEYRAKEKLDNAILRLLDGTNFKFKRYGQKYFAIYEDTKKGQKRVRKMGRHLNKIRKLEKADNVDLFQRVNKLDQLKIIGDAVIRSMKFYNVTGTVTSQTGEPLIGANIQIKGTFEGTSTDVDGKYEIEVSDSNAILIISYIGYQVQEVAVNGRSVVNVELVEMASQLDEVVVVGYGTMKKRDLTGSVTSVDIEKLSDIPNVSVIQAMQGTIAGLNVGAVDQAGENPTLSIRGFNTLSTSAGANAPLIVVDGIIYRGSLIDLNVADIESVDILKDASSASIYGSQASNGVLLITTKKGKVTDKPIINYSGSYTVQVPSNKLEPMRAAEYEEHFPKIYWENGSRLGPDFLQPNPDWLIESELKTLDIANGYAKRLDIPWWDTFTSNGYINNHNLSIRGKSNTLSYFISGGLTDVEGFMKNDTYTKYNYRINLDADITDWMNVGLESFLTSSDYSGVSPPITTSFFFQPWTPSHDDDGNIIPTPEGLSLNPYAFLTMDDSDLRRNIFANIHADIKLPVKGLSYRLNYSQNYRTINQDRFNPWGASFTGLGYKDSYINYDWSTDNILTYKNTFNKVHHLNATLLYGVEKRNFSFTETGAQNFVNDLLGYYALEAGDPTLRSLDTGEEEEQSLYSMGRIFYSYNNKYMITGTIRRDGFSGFGTNDKIGIFPSVALGWVASEENFVKNNLDWLNFLKLRASYGKIGRRGVGRYDTKAVLQSHPSIVFGDGGSATIGQWITTLANNELGWETTTGLNIGLDFEILNSRIFGNVEYYNNKTENILYPIQLPTLTGFSTINTNIGEVANNGIEIILNGRIFHQSDFKWNASINYSRNRNEIVSILGFDNDGDGNEDDLVANRLFIGEPQNVVYDYEIIGMWQLADRANETLPAGFAPGTYKIADLSGPDGEPDGEISAAFDRKILGYRDPGYRIGLANTFMYKQFSFYVFVNSIQGGKDYYFSEDRGWLHQNQYQNFPAGGYDFWMPENPDARYRRIDARSVYSPQRYMQRNFIRLQDVSLSYTFGKPLLEKVGISNLKVFVSGKNLATITDWRGWDPETGIGFTVGRPVMANYTFGLNIEL